MSDEDNSSGNLKLPHGISLEFLFSSPFCWKPSKTCDFLIEAHNHIHENAFEPEIMTFRINIDLQAKQYDLWNGWSNWRDTLGKEHYDILTTKYEIRNRRLIKRKNTQVNNTSVVELLAIIRNKLQHNKLFGESEMRKLKWFDKVNDRWEFSQRRYVNYFVTLFPNLAPFLWVQFLKFKQSPNLKKFFPFNTDFCKHDIFYNLLKFQDQVQIALRNQLEQGVLQLRYCMELELNTTTLEFRSLPQHLINRKMDGSSSVEMYMSENGIQSRWYDFQDTQDGSTQKVMTDEVTTEMTNQKFDIDCTVHIKHTLTDADEIALLEMLRNNLSFNDRRIIIFTHSETKVSDFAKSLTSKIEEEFNVDVDENPIHWDEISDEIRTGLEEVGEVRFQNSLFSLKKFQVQFNSQHKTDIFSCLAGDALNTLLKSHTLHVIQNHEVPQFEDASAFSKYIERGLYDLNRLDISILEVDSENDFFLVSGISLDKLENLVSAKITVVENMDVLRNLNLENADTKIFLIENTVSSCADSIMKSIGGGNSLHNLEYIGSNICQWVSSQGPFDDLERHFRKAALKLDSMNEMDFLDYLEVNGRIRKLIFIADKPGMGKSLVLKSLSKKIMGKYDDRIIVFCNMSKFITQFCSNEVLKSGVEDVIVNFLCNNEFEKSLIQYWLKLEDKLRFEIMFDGLDEVKLEERDVAIKAMKILKEEFKSVRVWVTLREHMLDIMRTKFYSLGFKLEPFSQTHKIEFLKDYWISKMDLEDIDEEITEKLQEFATECINGPFSDDEKNITGTPLICRIFAEIYERQVVSLDFILEPKISHSMREIYRQLIDTKFDIYLRGRKEFSDIPDDHFVITTARNVLENCNLYFAISFLFSEEVANMFQGVLLAASSINEREKLFSAALDHGIVQKLHPLTFIHGTVAEFLVAHFVVQVLNDNCSFMKKDNSLFKIFLWNNVLATQAIRRTYNFKFPTLCKFINDMKICGIKQNVYVSCALDIGRYSLMMLLETTSFLTKYFKEASIFISAHNNKHIRIINLLLHSPVQLTYSFFLTVLLYREYEIFKHLIQTYEQFGPGNWAMLQSEDEDHFSIMHWAVINLARAFCQLEENVLLQFVVNKYRSVGIKNQLSSVTKTDEHHYCLSHNYQCNLFEHLTFWISS